MTTQAYCLINSADNIVDNVVMWDGDTSTWTPPESHSYVLRDTTPSVEWLWDKNARDWVLTEDIGHGGIGFAWDGSVLTTTAPKPPPPPVPPSQPTVEGAQTL